SWAKPHKLSPERSRCAPLPDGPPVVSRLDGRLAVRAPAPSPLLRRTGYHSDFGVERCLVAYTGYQRRNPDSPRPWGGGGCPDDNSTLIFVIRGGASRSC